MLKKLSTNQKRIVYGILSAIVLLASLLTFIYLTNIVPTINKTADTNIVMPQEALKDDYYGVLVLGSDEGATRTNGGNHTDSIMYVAINIKTQKAYALPIYRDAFIENTCTNAAVNINHIYRDHGVDCLSQSMEKQFNIPINYYIYITSNGFVDLFNAIGPINIVPEETFVSNYGNDDQEYSFVAGQEQALNGNQLLAYARFRGNKSGEVRANRHVQILNQAYKACLQKSAVCIQNVSAQMLSQNIQTNFPYTAAIQLSVITDITLLPVIQGTNFEDETGWHQRINMDDAEDKFNIIKQEIFIN